MRTALIAGLLAAILAVAVFSYDSSARDKCMVNLSTATCYEAFN